MAKSIIVATNFTAFEFFNDKQMITRAMQAELTRVFYEDLYSIMDAFQITRVELPTDFQDAILTSIEAKQNITWSERYKENMKITYDTQLLVANKTRQQTVALAYGAAAQRSQQASAVTTVTEVAVTAESLAYGNVSAEVALTQDEGLSYIWWQAQYTTQAASSGKNFLVGMNPSTMIRT